MKENINKKNTKELTKMIVEEMEKKAKIKGNYYKYGEGYKDAVEELKTIIEKIIK